MKQISPHMPNGKYSQNAIHPQNCTIFAVLNPSSAKSFPLGYYRPALAIALTNKVRYKNRLCQTVVKSSSSTSLNVLQTMATSSLVRLL